MWADSGAHAMNKGVPTADFDGKDIMLTVCQDGVHTREFYRAEPHQRVELMELPRERDE